MKTQIAINEVGKELFVKMVLSAWETQNTRVSKLLNSLSDEQLSMETAPGRNRGIYLIGHLTAVSDGLFTLLGWGERLYPQLDAPFIKNPDKSVPDLPSAREIREYWNTVNVKIAALMNKMQPDDWFAKHTSISEEDFAREPHRNKLNIVINRTNHMSNHLGQLIYLGKKEE